jgi:hypothetical protein
MFAETTCKLLGGKQRRPLSLTAAVEPCSAVYNSVANSSLHVQHEDADQSTRHMSAMCASAKPSSPCAVWGPLAIEVGPAAIRLGHACSPSEYLVNPERKRGTAELPDRCQPDLSQQCDICDARRLEAGKGSQLPRFPARRSSVNRLHHLACCTHGCNGTLYADGIELGLMRKTPELALGHCLLYAWVDAVSSRRSVTFHGLWHETLKAYNG